MKRRIAALVALASMTTAITAPVLAAPPPFETVAPIAYMKDLSSGQVLFSKSADQRIPPASQAKMMTVYVIFDMLRKGEQIGRAHVLTPVTNAHLVCRLLLEKKKKNKQIQ